MYVKREIIIRWNKILAEYGASMQFPNNYYEDLYGAPARNVALWYRKEEFEPGGVFDRIVSPQIIRHGNSVHSIRVILNSISEKVFFEFGASPFQPDSEFGLLYDGGPAGRLFSGRIFQELLAVLDEVREEAREVLKMWNNESVLTQILEGRSVSEGVYLRTPDSEWAYMIFQAPRMSDNLAFSKRVDEVLENALTHNILLHTLILDVVPLNKGDLPVPLCDGHTVLPLTFVEGSMCENLYNDNGMHRVVSVPQGPVKSEGFYDFGPFLHQLRHLTRYGIVDLEFVKSTIQNAVTSRTLANISQEHSTLSCGLLFSLPRSVSENGRTYTNALVGVRLPNLITSVSSDGDSNRLFVGVSSIQKGTERVLSLTMALNYFKEDVAGDVSYTDRYTLGMFGRSLKEILDTSRGEPVLKFPELLKHGYVKNGRFLTNNRDGSVRYFPVESWSHTPTYSLIRHPSDGPSPLFMGTEIEMDNGSEDDVMSDLIVGALSRGENNVAYAMHDGSLNNGIEVATHPATLAAHMSHAIFDYDTAFAVAKIVGYEADDVRTAGLHVHVNRSFFGNDENVRMYRGALLALLIENNWEDFIKFARRNYGTVQQWAEKHEVKEWYEDHVDEEDDDETRRMEALRSSVNTDDKYRCVNFTHRNTFEIRIFKSTLNVRTYFATLQLVSNMCHLVKTLNYEEALEITLRDIVNFKHYSELDEYYAEVAHLSNYDFYGDSDDDDDYY